MRAVSALLLLGAAAPALAQHHDHSQPPSPPAAQACTPEHAAMGHCTMAAEPGAAPKEADPHAGHQMPEQQPADDPHAGHHMPEQKPADDPHAGHRMPEQQPASDPHAGHDTGAVPEPPKAAPPAEALAGPEHAADTAFDPAVMARSREELRRHHGDLPAHRFLVERAEARVREGRDGYLVDAQAWYGGDIDKAWFKAEVEGSWGERSEHVEGQALWSHAIGPWFDVQAGVRYDLQPGPDRAHLVLGVQGLAPYWWEVDGAVFVSNKGEVTARAEAEYDLRITQKLILQPRVELDFSFQDMSELGIGAGLTTAALGARLSYQVSPLFSPYVGVEYERAIGETADFRRDEGEDPGGWNLLAGVRFWF